MTDRNDGRRATDGNVSILIGELAATLAAHNQRLSDIEDKLDRVHDHMTDTLAARRAAMGVLSIVAAIATSLGGAVAWIAAHWTGRG